MRRPPTGIATASAGAQGPLGVPLPPHFNVTVGDCPDSAVGAISVECTYPDGRVFVDPGVGPFTFWHGVGHVFDFERLTPGKRRVVLARVPHSRLVVRRR